MKKALLYQLSYAPIPLDTDYSAETTNDSATNSAHLLHRFANRPSIDDGASKLRGQRFVEPLRPKGRRFSGALRITTPTLAPEGSHQPHASGF
jgi:hypothetical protein